MKECDWMAKKRIYEVAKEIGVDNKVVVQKAKDLGFDVKNHMSSIDDSQVTKLKGSFQNSAPAKKKAEKKQRLKRIIKLRSLFLLFGKMRRDKKKIQILKSLEDVIVNVVRMIMATGTEMKIMVVIDPVLVNLKQQLCLSN